jgi:hypothetical protein
VIGVPAAADVGLLRRFLAHLGDLDSPSPHEEAVDVDRGPAPREFDVLSA